MTTEEKTKIMDHVKNFCQENAGNRLSANWLCQALLLSTNAICDDLVGAPKDENNNTPIKGT